MWMLMLMLIPLLFNGQALHACIHMVHYKVHAGLVRPGGRWSLACYTGRSLRTSLVCHCFLVLASSKPLCICVHVGVMSSGDRRAVQAPRQPLPARSSRHQRGTVWYGVVRVRLRVIHVHGTVRCGFPPTTSRAFHRPLSRCDTGKTTPCCVVFLQQV